METILVFLKERWSIITAVAAAAWGCWEHYQKQKAEKELHLIRRRAHAPFLSPSDQRFDRVCYNGDKPYEIRYWAGNNSNVLSILRAEVGEDCPAEAPVVFVIDVDGASARKVKVTLDDSPIQLEREPEMNFTQGLIFLQYPFDPSKRGKQQKLKLSFETESGYQDTHTYLTEHGRRKLVRADPP